MQDIASLNATPRYADRSVCMKWAGKALEHRHISLVEHDRIVVAIHFVDNVKTLAKLFRDHDVPPLLDPSDLTEEEKTSVFAFVPPTPKVRFARIRRWWDKACADLSYRSEQEDWRY